MEIQKNYPLQSLNTFGIKVDGKYFAQVASLAEIEEALDFAGSNDLPVLVLGGGSNVLFTQNYPGLILKMDIRGIEKVEETVRHVVLKVGAGENWDEFVNWCVEQSLCGLENLSLIPGNVGASPVQNIGAYGVEMEEYFQELEFFDFENRKLVVYDKKACGFGYRNSIFKRALKDKGVVTTVTFILNKEPMLKTGYGSIREELQHMDVNDPTIRDLREAVIRIRNTRLPDPKKIGNAGSFFKNPAVEADQFEQLQNTFPGIISFPLQDGRFKIAAGWLIEHCGWKGCRKGNAGVHENQALVLVNYGGSSGNEIFELSEEIRSSVDQKFGIILEREVNVI